MKTGHKVVALVIAVCVGLMWFHALGVAAQIGELEFVGFPSQVAVTGAEVQLEGWLKFNQEEHDYSTNIRLWVTGHEGRIEPKFIAGPLYDGDMVLITVFLEGVPGIATLHADDPRCPYGVWTIQLVQATPTSTPTVTPTFSPTPTNTPTPTHTPTHTPTVAPTFTPTPTPTNTPTNTSTPVPDTPTSTPTSTPTPTLVPNTPTPTPTPTPTWTATVVPPSPTPTTEPPPVVENPGAWYEISSNFRVHGQWVLIEGLGGYGWELATLPEFDATVAAGSILEASLTLTNTTTPPLSTLNGVVVKVWAEELDKTAERPEDEWKPTKMVHFSSIVLVSRSQKVADSVMDSFSVALGRVAIGGVDQLRFLVKIRADVEAGTDFVVRFNVSWREPYALEEFLPGTDGTRGNEIGQRFTIGR